MHQRKTRSLKGIGVLLAIAGLTFTSVTDATAGTAQPGAPGIGDRLFPSLGNGGYDVQHYTPRLRYATAEPAQQITGTITLDAVASQNLSSFNMDFAGDAVGSVKVNGRPARFDFQQQAEELVITPDRVLCRGGAFTVEVAFTSHISAPEADNPYPVGWIATPRGSFTSFQPNLAHGSLPVNDHPSDPATWTFQLDVPQGVTAVTNGVRTSARTANGRTVWTYEEREQLPTELVQLAVGDDPSVAVVDRGTVAGRPYRDVIATSRQDLLAPAFARGPALLEWVADKVGPLPPGTYGNLGIDLPIWYSLETKGFILHSVDLFDPKSIPGKTGVFPFYGTVMVHEYAHELYGNSVMPQRWSSDLWLNEGFATYMMMLWAHETGSITVWGYPSLEAYVRDVYSQGDSWRAQFGPVAAPLSVDALFGPQAYDGAAVALYALQQMVGPEKFWKIARGWPKEFHGRAASTEDFIAYANRISGQNLTKPLRAWLYGDRTPQMPGHPDWTVDPVTATTQAETHGTSGTSGGRRAWASAS